MEKERFDVSRGFTRTEFIPYDSEADGKPGSVAGTFGTAAGDMMGAFAAHEDDQ